MTLEQAVLANDIGGVGEILDDCTGPDGVLTRPVARALGFACRYAGPEMTELLLDAGASFSYDDTPEAWAANAITGGDIVSRAAEPYLYFMRSDLPLRPGPNMLQEMDRHYERISKTQQFEVLRMLQELEDAARAKTHYYAETYEHSPVNFDPYKLLYYAAVYDDQGIRKTLGRLGVRKLEGEISWCLTGSANGLPRQDRDAWIGALVQAMFAAKGRAGLDGLRKRVRTVTRDGWRLTRGDINRAAKLLDAKPPEDWNEDIYLFLLKYTGYVWSMRHRDALEMFIARDWRSALAEGLRIGLCKTWEQYEELAAHAERTGAPAAVVEIIRKAQDASGLEPPRQWSDAKTPLQTQQLTWGYDKKSNDGRSELTIKSYKGWTPSDVVVPEQIGKYPVVGIASRTFDVERAANERIREARRAVSSVTLPGSIREVPQHFMAKHPGVTKVTLGEGVEIIAKEAFSSCPELAEVVLPESLAEIQDGAFKGCEKLATVRGLSKDARVARDAFSDCPALVLDEGQG